MWQPVGAELSVSKDEAEILKTFGEILEEKAVENGEKSCVERAVTDAKADEPTVAPPKKARSAKRK